MGEPVLSYVPARHRARSAPCPLGTSYPKTHLYSGLPLEQWPPTTRHLYSGLPLEQWPLPATYTVAATFTAAPPPPTHDTTSSAARAARFAVAGGQKSRMPSQMSACQRPREDRPEHVSMQCECTIKHHASRRLLQKMDDLDACGRNSIKEESKAGAGHQCSSDGHLTEG